MPATAPAFASTRPPPERRARTTGNACTSDACNGAGVCVHPATPGVPCADDGDLCTADACDSAGDCVHPAVPAVGCRPAAKSSLLIKNSSDDSKDRLTWKWLKGAATTLAELGLPTDTTRYAFCLYSGTSAASVGLPAGAKWQTSGTTGYKFTDPSSSPDGAKKALLRSGAAGKAKVLVKGKGSNLPDSPAPALSLPVTAQLVNDANAVCFEAVYDQAAVITNDATQFKAKAD